jgi:transcription antitermination factor NusA-like protein
MHPDITDVSAAGAAVPPTEPTQDLGMDLGTPTPESASEASVSEASVSEALTAEALLASLLAPRSAPAQARLVTFTVATHSADVASVVCFDGTEAMLPASEWFPGRQWRRGDRLTGLLVQSDPATVSVVRDEQIPLMLAGLVPEVRDGSVRVMGVARLPGVRTKVAVASTVASIDPVAACVGRKANRVRALVTQLGGERVDIITFSDDPKTMLAAALAPAQVDSIRLDGRRAEVLVPPHRMAATVGEGGLNAQLAGQLAGFSVQVIAS